MLERITTRRKLILGVVILVVVVALYWIGSDNSHIVQKCGGIDGYARAKTIERQPYNSVADQQRTFDYWYKICLHENGIR